jgi:hypothetical protein
MLEERDIKKLLREIRNGNRSIDDFGDVQIELGPRIQKKGREFLYNHLHDLGPFEIHVLNNFSQFMFLGFFPKGKSILPVYRCCSKGNSSFDYIYQGGIIEIISISSSLG